MTGPPYTCSNSSLDLMRRSLSRFSSISSSSLSDDCGCSSNSVAKSLSSVYENKKDGQLTRGKICDGDFVTVLFLRRDSSSEEICDSCRRDHNVLVERQLFVALGDGYDNLDARPT